MYLLDTMVVSERRRSSPDAGVASWLRSVPVDTLFISAITFGEIAVGIEKARTEPMFQARLIEWLDRTRQLYGARIVAVDAGIAIIWGELYSRLGRRDVDLLIAATALNRSLIVVTRNVRHFEPTGVRLLNPYS